MTKRITVGLLPFDSKIPNLALMQLSTCLGAKGHVVSLFDELECKPDVVYVSLVFSWNKDRMLEEMSNYKAFYPDVKFVFGGSGYSLEKTLPNKIERLKPDYDLYPSTYSMGFTSRGCFRKCKFCIVPEKEGMIREHSSLKDIIDDRFEGLMLLDNNFLASPNWKEKLKELKDRNIKVDFNQGLDMRLLVDDKHKEATGLLADLQYYGYPDFKRKTLRFAFDHPNDREIIRKGINLLTSVGIKADRIFFYILSGYNTTIAEDVERVNFVHSLGARPFIMNYRDPNSAIFKRTPNQMKLAKWVNHIPYYEVYSFEEFDPSITKKKASGVVEY